MNGWRWTEPAAPHVTQIALPDAGSAEVQTVFSSAQVRTIVRAVEPAALPALGVVSLRMSALRLKVRSCRFPEPMAIETPGAEPRAANAIADQAPSIDHPTWTRVHPPADVVALEDRWFYVLQPPLEVVFATRSLDFPMHPFGYQLEGIAFLYARAAAVLADEMGLGKTMQAITAIRLLLHAGQARHVLLVCPKPLVTNWQREFHVWAPELPVMVIEGDAARRSWQWQLPETPVRIANYELLHRDREALAHLAFPYDLVVLDESQRIKNRASATSDVVRSIPRRRSWALTGTPIENSPEDLVGIFEFVAPGRLKSDMEPRRMGTAAGDYILRRTKDKVLKDLPPKMFRDAELDLLPSQRETYRLAEEEGVLRLTEMGPAATIQHVFELVMRLKQICNFDPATGDSAKLERLSADLEEVVDSGRKAIVFSQWVETLETLGRALEKFSPLAYHGRIASGRRDDVIREFRDDPRRSVLLLSYGAGGVGLNLQFANYVFLFDRWWNPAVEDQAINRAHRIGGSGPVTVTRFLALNTIEQRINQVLEEKRGVFETVLGTSSSPQSSGLTQRELFGLFKLQCPTGPIRLGA
ncbi:MAG TPA: DEAD/DEAH box helicase [Pirellulales bacterium]|nr:DEAD/DEAH box helicase [Pirellulales bacterium]